jgi:hypothetical protein
METGVRTSESLRRVAFHYETALPAVIDLDDRRPLERAGNIAGRFAKLVFLDEPIAEIEGTVVHEVFGHGARARDLGGTADYKLRLPGIYCWLLSTTRDMCTSFTDSTVSFVEPDRALLATEGGIEANSLLAWWIDERMVAQDGALHHGDLLVYFGTKLVYGSSFLSPDLDVAGKLQPANNDVDRYVTQLQDRFNRWREQDRVTVASRLRRAYLWNLLDPMLVFSAYGTIEHVAFGDRILRFPLPRAFGVSFYPTPRFVPSPYGAESYLDLFVARGTFVVDAYGRAATNGLARADGLGVRAFGLRLHDRVTAGAELDVWNQPETLFDVHAAYTRPQVWGMNAGVSADVRLVGALGMTARLAWKSKGWLTGQPIDEGLYGWVGASVAWDDPR